MAAFGYIFSKIVYCQTLSIKRKHSFVILSQGRDLNTYVISKKISLSQLNVHI